MTVKSSASIRRQQDWERITKLEFRQELQDKELANVVDTNKRLSESLDALGRRVDDVNATFKQIRNISIGMAVILIAQVAGVERAIVLLLGL